MAPPVGSASAVARARRAIRRQQAYAPSSALARLDVVSSGAARDARCRAKDSCRVLIGSSDDEGAALPSKGRDWTWFAIVAAMASTDRIASPRPRSSSNCAKAFATSPEQWSCAWALGSNRGLHCETRMAGRRQRSWAAGTRDGLGFVLGRFARKLRRRNLSARTWRLRLAASWVGWQASCQSSLPGSTGGSAR